MKFIFVVNIWIADKFNSFSGDGTFHKSISIFLSFVVKPPRTDMRCLICQYGPSVEGRSPLTFAKLQGSKPANT